MNQTWDLTSLARMRGCDVITSDGTGIGEINEILCDYASAIPVWIGVSPVQGIGIHRC
jgi:hypothetical protein